MSKIRIEYKSIELIYRILSQIGGPTKLTYGSYIYTDITEKLVEKIYIIIKESYVNKKDAELNIFELFSLIRILDYIIVDLGINEFQTVVGYDITDGLVLISQLRKLFKHID